MLSTQLRTQLEQLRELPTPPRLAAELIAIAEAPEVSLAAVAGVIDKDPALAVKLLRVVNSPLYSRGRRRETVRQAILALGLNGTMTLALGFSLVASLRGRESVGLDYTSFWRRSLMAANAARALADAACLDCAEQAFLGALLQDIGIIALDRADPAFYAGAPDLLADHAGLIAHERARLGTEHAAVGAWLLDRWHLAEPVCEAVATSDAIGAIAADAPFARFARCVALSGAVADLWFMDDPHDAMSALAVAAERHLAIAPGRLLDVLALLREQLGETEAAFEMDILDAGQAANILERAKAALAAREAAETDAWDVAAGEPPAVRGSADLERLLAAEYAVAVRERWPLSVAAVTADGRGAMAAEDAAAAVQAALDPGTPGARLADGRLLLLFSGSDGADVEATLRRTLPAGTATAAGSGVTLRAGIATLAAGDDRYGSGDNLLRAACAALHRATRDATLGGIAHAVPGAGDEAVALAVTADAFTARRAP